MAAPEAFQRLGQVDKLAYMHAWIKTFSRIYLALFVMSYFATKVHALFTHDSGSLYVERHWPFWAATLVIALLGGLADRFGPKRD